MNKLIKLSATFFYLGYIPVIPGTVASAAALVFYFLFSQNLYIYTLFLLVFCVLGFLTAGRAERMFREKDPLKIVIDEVAGVLLAFWGLKLDLPLLIVGFFIFRALDAVKVYPADRLERVAGSLGIMGDDLIAGLYTNLALQLATRLFPI